jgi:hypothetical protein
VDVSEEFLPVLWKSLDLDESLSPYERAFDQGELHEHGDVGFFQLFVGDVRREVGE